MGRIPNAHRSHPECLSGTSRSAVLSASPGFSYSVLFTMLWIGAHVSLFPPSPLGPTIISGGDKAEEIIWQVWGPSFCGALSLGRRVWFGANCKRRIIKIQVSCNARNCPSARQRMIELMMSLVLLPRNL